MRYHFMNMVGELIASVEADHVARVNPCESGYETEAAIQWLFSDRAPPTNFINLVGTHDGVEHWSVGPFDLLVRKEGGE